MNSITEILREIPEMIENTLKESNYGKRLFYPGIKVFHNTEASIKFQRKKTCTEGGEIRKFYEKYEIMAERRFLDE